MERGERSEEEGVEEKGERREWVEEREERRERREKKERHQRGEEREARVAPSLVSKEASIHALLPFPVITTSHVKGRGGSCPAVVVASVVCR